MLTVSGREDIRPVTGNLTLGCLVTQDRASITYRGRPELDEDTYTLESDQGAFGVWAPITENYDESVNETVVQFGRGEITQTLADLICRYAYLETQMGRLIRGPRADGGNNELYQWNALLARLPGNWGNAPLTQGYLALAEKGVWLARTIAADLPKEDANLNNVLAVLADYQLVLDPRPDNFGHLAFLLEDAEAKEAPKLMAWRDTNNREIKADQMIACDHLLPGGGTDTVETGSEGQLLRVKEPANSFQEAHLEIELQRTKLTLDKYRATATTDMDVSWLPLDTFSYQNRVWQVLAVTHKWPLSFSNAPFTTEFTLRGLPE